MLTPGNPMPMLTCARVDVTEQHSMHKPISRWRISYPSLSAAPHRMQRAAV
jgi:hypothetical protein